MPHLAKKGFTLVELLVVIAVMAMLMGILLPSLAQARLQSKILAANIDLQQIGIALECYYDDYKKYPPTREDCQTGKVEDHLYQLPEELARGGYLPAANSGDVMATIMEDRFHRGHTYKYRSPGEVYKDRGVISKHIPARLWIPNNFPSASSIDENKGQKYPNDSERWQYLGHYSLFTKQSPVTWVVFSLGPGFDGADIQGKVGNRYPVSKELWYSTVEKRYPVSEKLWYVSKSHTGFLVRLRLKNGQQIGTFQKDY
ncbi:MAG: hypothetical protein CVV39_03485 [Planctomycetes bacterium HGW-Planctomycetes-1]|nr:MAG: hypothetical protein CVV39_03485 [Planctomycetes bacterium HGW-Planctomycetes-1]